MKLGFRFAIIFGSIGITLCAGTAILLGIFLLNLQTNSLRTKAVGYSQLMARIAIPSVENFEYGTLDQFAKEIRSQDNDVIAITFLGVAKDTLAGKDSATTIIASDTLLFVTPIKKDDGTILGSVRLIASLTQVKSVQHKLILFLVICSLGIFVLMVVSSLLAVKAVVIKPLSSVQSRIEGLSQGDADLTILIKHAGKSEIDAVAQSVNTLLDSLLATITQIFTHSQSLESSSITVREVASNFSHSSKVLGDHAKKASDSGSALANNITTIAASAMQVSNNTREIAAAIEEMTASLSNVSGHCSEEVIIVNDVRESGQRATTAMDSLDATTKEIDRIMDSIQDISETTSLLSLNATIEAATAGAAGKGFAVVASEIKELSRQSGVATQEIQGKIEEIKSRIAESRLATESMITQIEKLSRISISIANSASEQSQAIQDISRGLASTAQSGDFMAKSADKGASQSSEIAGVIQQVHGASKLSQENATKLSDDANTLADIVEQLRHCVEHFKIT